MDSKEVREENDGIIADRIVEVMNKAVEADKTAIRALTEQRVSCNAALAGHPAIQVTQSLTDRESGNPPRWFVGLLGILNGIAGALPDGYGRIEARFELKCSGGCLQIEKQTGRVEGDPCPRCEAKLVVGDLIGFELSDEMEHQNKEEAT